MRYTVLLLLVAVAGLFNAPLSAAETRDPRDFFFHETFGDFQEELALAREEGKRGVMIFFEMDECPFCHWMKENVLNRPQVQDYFREHFLLFSVDVEGDIEITDFTGEPMAQKDFAFKKNRVRATPVFAFFDLEGNRVHRHTGKTASVEEFLLMGEYVAEGVYEEMPFTRFKRARRR